MKVVITASGQEMESTVDLRFGRAKYFILVDSATGEHSATDNSQNLNAAQGAGIQAGQNVVGLGAEAVITGNVGPKAFRVLEAAKIKIFLCDDNTTVAEAVERLKGGELQEVNQANVEGHWV